MTIEEEVATNKGIEAGHADAQRHNLDPENFESTPNPYGIDSEAKEHEAWETGYESIFEAEIK